MVVSSRRRSPLARAQALWSVRKIFWLLVRRDLKIRYADSALGYLWTIIDPLLMSLVYWTLFATLFNRNVPGESPYIVFLLAGMLPWQWFTGTVNQTARSLNSASRLIGSTDLPREIWVLRIVAANGIEYLLSLPVLAAFVIAYRVPLHLELVTLPIAIAIQFVLLSGIGLLLAPLVVLVPDLGRLIKVVLRLMFYASPILYSVDRLPERIQWIYVVNPLSDILQLSRTGYFPQLLDWRHVGFAAAVSIVVLAIGWYVFAKLERTILKEI